MKLVEYKQSWDHKFKSNIQIFKLINIFFHKVISDNSTARASIQLYKIQVNSVITKQAVVNSRLKIKPN